MGYRPWGRKELDTTERLHSLTHSGKELKKEVPSTLKSFSSQPSNNVSAVLLYPLKGFIACF